TPRGTSAFWNIKLNPVPRTDGKFNPFTIREIREAMNWLIDREFIADEIYGGLGFPHIVLFHPKEPDYGRLAGYIAGVEAQYGYDPSKADSVITQAMQAAGATKVGGKWQHGGEPVTITFIIRTSPTPRTRYGEYIAGLMEGLGFTVVRDFKTGGQASPIVYSGDPRAGQWQMYTEGWGSTAMTLWSQYRGYQMFQWPAYSTIWNYHSVDATTDQAISDWFLQNFATPEERAELIKTAIAGTVKDSSRVWLVAEESMFAARSDIGLVYGLAAGFNELYTVRTARKAGVGGELRISQFEGFVGGWNPIGITWLFDRNIEYSYRDPGGVWPHPHTGKMVPFRASDWTIETNGTTGSVPIASDAIVWNMTSRQWEQVGAGKTTLSKVTFTFEMGKWHHGMPITMQDILAGIAATYRLEHPDGDAYNTSHEGQWAFPHSIWKGFRVLGNMSWPLIDRLNVSNEIEVYVDFWHWDEGEIAAAADVWVANPWETWEVMIKT
ncbi:MAG: hypothetical protein GTO63_20900, partial [Anaerolineae bacterium]|nr:hypothetical protein [Anaerolineae bacterium]NIN97239.1 hypothetical protein [Anaerolineae bacterium]